MPAVLSQKSPHTPHGTKSRDAFIKAASPGYFGLTVDGSGTTATSSSGGRAMRQSYSPPGSSIRSSAVSPPLTLPFHSTTNNHDLDAFRQEVSKRGSSFSQCKTTTSRPERTTSSTLNRPATPPKAPVSTSERSDRSSEESEPSVRSPKRALSTYATDHDRPRPQSPAQPQAALKPPRLRLSDTEAFTAPPANTISRAETLPEKSSTAPSLVTAQHIITLLESHAKDETLILDLRNATAYLDSHIIEALNLCIPTTLLKRSSYNVTKLVDTFKDPAQRKKFETWRRCNRIIVYDGSSTHLKDAANCVNILKKFTTEGWTGESIIIRGGFVDFAKNFPKYLNKGSKTSRKSSVPSLSLKISDDDDMPPVIGGCPMPATKSAANPFFNNIRQNMDLIGGVGQIAIKLPANASKASIARLPKWLQLAADPEDQGKRIAQKFLHIEKREQKRMQQALSGNVTYGTPGPNTPKKVEIAGIEKGAKNRYNNIFPFEHSRVKLEGPRLAGCDYINANHIASSLSEKTYIATQAPISATFNDYWSMIWQNQVRVIVMLTAESEGGQIKAHNYWDQRHYGPFKLKFLSEHRASLEPGKIKQHRQRPAGESRRTSNVDASPTASKGPGDVCGPKVRPEAARSASSVAPHVVVRKFTLSHEGEPFSYMREITQLHYSDWPDFGAPADASDILGLTQQCDAVVRASAGGQPVNDRPVLIHCSAGCGRTGTFSTVDSVIDVLSRQRAMRKITDKTDAPPPKKKNESDNPFFSPPAQIEDAPAVENTSQDKDEVDLIEKTVEQFRLQRLSMVQSLRQFVLCYETVIQWLLNQDQDQDQEKVDSDS